MPALAAELKRMIRRCHGGRMAECRIIEALADHGHCSTEHEVELAQVRKRTRPLSLQRLRQAPAN